MIEETLTKMEQAQKQSHAEDKRIIAEITATYPMLIFYAFVVGCFAGGIFVKIYKL